MLSVVEVGVKGFGRQGAFDAANSGNTGRLAGGVPMVAAASPYRISVRRVGHTRRHAHESGA
jgi:hypothetical protein